MNETFQLVAVKFGNLLVKLSLFNHSRFNRSSNVKASETENVLVGNFKINCNVDFPIF